jgi:heat shock protein HspQ
MVPTTTKFTIGQILRHRHHPFRGVVIDIDPVYSNGDEWYERIATTKPRKDQPWYHLLAEDLANSHYLAYVSEQNLLIDETAEPVAHPDLPAHFGPLVDGTYQVKQAYN